MGETSGIRGDVSMGFVQNVDLIQAKMKESIAPPPNTFGDASTVIIGRTIRFEPWEIGLKNYSTTLPEDDKEVREQITHLANRTLLKAPHSPNLGNHG